LKHPMSDHSRALVQKLWNYCTVLRDDGMSYGDYVEQLTYLLFLKMAHERAQPPRNEPSRIPVGYDWPSLLDKTGPKLEVHYIETLRELAKQDGLLGLIFRKSQNKIQDPAKLRRLIVDLIDPETWTGIDADVKGDVYEGLLEKNAADLKSGAGQYFTPRVLIKAIVDVMRPGPDMTVADPACGTGGFLLAAHDYIADNQLLDRDQKKFLRDHALRGNEIVDNTARLCAMNLYLHGVGSATVDATPPVTVGDALLQEPADKVDMVLANPPFGKKSSITMIGEGGKAANGDSGVTIARQDFWATTSNKQLNFLQHIRSMLRISGEAAVVLPDNVLFEGGAGATIRKRLLQECDLHTILRLPTGLFYAQGVKANVLFFTRKAPSGEPATKHVWVYDFRTNQRFTLKTRAMTRADLQPFVEAYKPGRRHERVEAENFKRWSYDEIKDRDGFNLDIWADVKDESLTDAASLPAPEVIAAEIIEEVSAGLAEFAAVAAELEGGIEENGRADLEQDGVKALVEDVEL
jgi:type I restriction enzyme M protein